MGMQQIEFTRPTDDGLNRLPFPPLAKSHIQHCSYHFWHPLYRSITPKSRLIPLSGAFISYLRADGIILPTEDTALRSDIETDSGIFSSCSTPSEADSDTEESDPALQWLEVHQEVKATIAELGGSVVPKLNWSAPKDATWISATNSMECLTPNDIYLLLKSSDFVTHDLEQAFNGCVAEEIHTAAPTQINDNEYQDTQGSPKDIPYYLVLRKTIPSLVTSLEFRCFVRSKRLLCICQRDLNHYSFLSSLVPTLRSMIQDFFDQKLKTTFPDENFVFDVYVPQVKEKGRVWLVDINPWAERTDPLLFSWLELLTIRPPLADDENDILETGVLRISLHDGSIIDVDGKKKGDRDSDCETDDDASDGDSGTESENEVGEPGPEFRLVNRDDPEAYCFNTPQYSAHKLPKDIVDASLGGKGGMQEFMGQWRDVVARQEREDAGEADLT